MRRRKWIGPGRSGGSVDVRVRARVRVDLRVDQVQQVPEQPLLAAVRCRGHQQRARGVLGEQPPDLVELCRGRGEPVGLVEDDEVPAGLVRPDGVLDRGFTAASSRRHDPQVVAADGVLAHGVGGQVPQAAAEEAARSRRPTWWRGWRGRR